MHRYPVPRAIRELVSHVMQVHECLEAILDLLRLANKVVDWGGLTLTALDEQFPRVQWVQVTYLDAKRCGGIP